MGKARANDRSELEMDEHFMGKENPIELVNEFKTQIFCAFRNMHRYPFQEEGCTLVIILKDTDDRLISLNHYFIDHGPTEFMQYKINGWSTEKSVHGLAYKLHISVTFGRDLNVILLVTFLPTILMNCLNQASNYITKNNPDSFGILIEVNITSMMVLTTLYIFISTSLPATTKIKSIDIWLLSSLVYPFCVIIVNILIHHNNSKRELYASSTQVVQNQTNSAQVLPDLRENDEHGQPQLEFRPVHREERAKSILLFLAFYGIPVIYSIFVVFYFYDGLAL